MFWAMVGNSDLRPLLFKQQTGVIFRKWKTARRIIINGHLNLLKLKKQQKHYIQYAGSDFQTALYNNNLEIAKWLYKNMSKLKEFSINYYNSIQHSSIVKHGNLEMIKWLVENNIGTQDSIIEYAAEYGHLHIIEWVCEYSDYIQCRWAMDFAAKNGHLHVVKWLYKHRTEGCSTTAINGASINGHEEVSNWLKTHPDAINTDRDDGKYFSM